MSRTFDAVLKSDLDLKKSLRTPSLGVCYTLGRSVTLVSNTLRVVCLIVGSKRTALLGMCKLFESESLCCSIHFLNDLCAIY